MVYYIQLNERGLWDVKVLTNERCDMVEHKYLFKLVPEAEQLYSRRLAILTLVSLNDGIGRRSIAQHLKLSERLVRNDIDYFKQCGLFIQKKTGLFLSDSGQKLIEEFRQTELKNGHLLLLEEQLRNKYDIQNCIVVSGDVNKQQDTIVQLGQALTNILDAVLPVGKNIISVSGGTTLSKVVSHVSKKLTQNRQFYVVPARGSGSGDLSIQANTISHTLANRLNGETLNLYVPEQINSNSRELLLEDPNISNTISLLKKSNCLIYSIGNAKIMAQRRGASEKEIEEIMRCGAVGESMGVFFDAQGNIIYRLARIGLLIEDLSNLPCEVLVVGGSNKTAALSAYLKIVPKQTILIVDEALANSVLKEGTL